MPKELIIAIFAFVTVLVIYILIKYRKKIFKKKVPKTKKVEENKEIVDNSKEIPADVRISFEKRESTKKQESNINATIESVDWEDEEEKLYSSSSMFPSPRNFRRPMPIYGSKNSYFKPEKKSIRCQIKELSPEMKAILFTNILGKKDDQF